MRIPPSNMGWQSTAVIKWAIFCQVSRCKENSWQFSVAKYTFLVWRYLYISLNIFLSLQESFYLKSERTQLLHDFCASLHQRLSFTLHQSTIWQMDKSWDLIYEPGARKHWSMFGQSWRLNLPFSKAVTAQGDPNLHLLPLEGEQGLLGVVQGLQLRSCRRIIKHLVELIPLNSSTGKGLWLHHIKQARKGGWGPSPGQERETNPRSTW